MAQAVRDASEQAQLIREIATQGLPPNTTPSQLLGGVTHDQLCDVINENLLNSELEASTGSKISTMSLQAKGRSQSSSNSASL